MSARRLISLYSAQYPLIRLGALPLTNQNFTHVKTALSMSRVHKTSEGQWSQQVVTDAVAS